MKRLWIIAVLALAAVLATGSLATAGLFGDKEVETEKLVIGFYNQAQRGGYAVVDVATLKGWLDAKKPMIIVDCTPYDKSYKKNHIPGAVQFLFPLQELTSMKPEDQAKFKKLLGANQDALLVFYCGHTRCARSHNGAMWAKKLGYKNVYRCPGGIKAWKEMDYPTASK